MKREGQKMRLFAVKEILERETDKHSITMDRILQLLQTKYDMKAERKSIYDDMRAFRESEILDVTPPQGRERGYSVAERLFHISELKMMIDAIQSSKFITEKKSNALIRKLERLTSRYEAEILCSKYEAQNLQRDVVLSNRVKSINSSSVLFRNIDVIHRAISLNAQISFQYFTFDLKKQKKYMRKGERYQVSPWSMIYTDDNYYLLAYIDGDFKHFRVDKMDNVQAFILEEGDSEIVTLEREGREAFEKKDMSAYTKYTFSMYGDNPTPVTMVFQNRMVGVVMDRFGRDVLIMREDDRHFRITVPVAVSDQFFGWVFGLGKTVRIVGPEDVKAKMKKALADISARYED